LKEQGYGGWIEMKTWHKIIWGDCLEVLKIFRKLKSFLRRKKIKRQFSYGLRLIASIDKLMAKEGWPRQKRREFWRKFISKANKLDAISELFDGEEKGEI